MKKNEFWAVYNPRGRCMAISKNKRTAQEEALRKSTHRWTFQTFDRDWEYLEEDGWRLHKSVIYSIHCEGHDELKAIAGLKEKLDKVLASTNTLSMHLAQFTNESGEARKAWNLNPAPAASVSQTSPAPTSATKIQFSQEATDRIRSMSQPLPYTVDKD